MSEFHDPELRQQLGRLSGPYPDDNAAFAAWQRRVGQARRRRAVAWTSGAAVSLVLAMVAVAAVNGPGRRSVVPADSPNPSISFTVTAATTEAEDSTVPSSEAETTAPTTAPVTEPVDSTVVSVSIDSSVPENEGEGSGSQGGGTRGHGGTPTTQATVAPQSATTETKSTIGGSVTVRKDGDKLTVIDASPAPGFTSHEDEHSGERVEVTFRSATTEVKVTARIADDGSIKMQTSTDGVAHEESVPNDTSADDHSGGGSERGGNG